MPLFRRADGDYIPDIPPYRQIMPFIMRSRAESNVLFEQHLDAERGLAFIQRWNEAHPDKRISFLHLLTHALVQTLHEWPKLNRFTMGGRHYQRKGIWISYSGKKAFTHDAPVVAFKQEMKADASFAARVDQLSGAVKEGKSDKESSVDKELKIFLRVPAFLLRLGVKLLFWLDSWNLLPHFFFRDDPLYSSAFIANLGSIKLDAGFHHLFEYGNIPVFVVIGKHGPAPYVKPDGTLGVRQEIILRWNYDERVEDGLYCARALDALRERLESPDEWLGRELPAARKSA